MSVSVALVNAPTRQEVLAAYGDWLSSLEQWEWFVTLTFRNPTDPNPLWSKPGWAYAKSAWAAFIARVRHPVGPPVWVRAFELQRDRGVPHIHGLLANVSDMRRAEAGAWAWRTYGLNRILRYDNSLGAAHYLCKYVSKELGDLEFSPGFLGPLRS